jgi:transposase
MQTTLRNAVLRSEEARYDHRLHGVLLISQGMPCYEVGEIFGHDSPTIQRWIRSFETRGFSGLENQKRPGRPQRLTLEGLEIVNRDIRGPPHEFGRAQNLWDGKLLAHCIAGTQKLVLGTHKCQRLFYQLEFRLGQARPIIIRTNLEE